MKLNPMDLLTLTSIWDLNKRGGEIDPIHFGKSYPSHDLKKNTFFSKFTNRYFDIFGKKLSREFIIRLPPARLPLENAPELLFLEPLTN